MGAEFVSVSIEGGIKEEGGFTKEISKEYLAA
jgi:NAD/NADP transhydrogenase alpha subunit